MLADQREICHELLCWIQSLLQVGWRSVVPQCSSGLSRTNSRSFSAPSAQNLVEYESRLQLKTGATTIHYTVNSGNVVLRLRQALFVRTAKDIYGETVCFASPCAMLMWRCFSCELWSLVLVRTTP